MFVITADQVGSRAGVDHAPAATTLLNERYAAQLLLSFDQTAGDEIQGVTESAPVALAIVLDLAREQRWSIGLGVGDVRHPLPDAARKAAGAAFISARDAVEAAKRNEARFALRCTPFGDSVTADDVEPLIRLLLMARARRTDAGWEVVDLLEAGRTQKEAAEILDISAPAVSMRLKAAWWQLDRETRPALARLLDDLDANATHLLPDNGRPTPR
ncbi:DNA-binding protein [Glaciibacter flavus]|uniref:DNA-binding protein n=1 Tax=Orlajensenia flava TaxID=2565934 RepID=A0A4S4FLY8_9MICO|nr:DNA-binding protein [Glaciibacter flavus]THG31221.1 DNA-binding protein [Glaciibacter flavus]